MLTYISNSILENDQARPGIISGRENTKKLVYMQEIGLHSLEVSFQMHSTRNVWDSHCIFFGRTTFGSKLFYNDWEFEFKAVIALFEITHFAPFNSWLPFSPPKRLEPFVYSECSQPSTNMCFHYTSPI